MKKPSINDVLEEMRTFDLYCMDFNLIRPNRIVFYNSARYLYDDNDDPYLELKFFKDRVKVNAGKALTSSELKKSFRYKIYDNIYDFSEELSYFVAKYFKSFKYVRVFNDDGCS